MEGRSLDKILSESELKALFELMDNPAWTILDKINKEVSQDWIEQTASLDFTDKTDKEMVRKLRHRQGQIKGVSTFLLFLNKKKKEWEKKLEKEMNKKVVQ